ncbi:MAG: hypothetical protein IK031_07055 [Bacteroidales bacterium]|nr:hypothetical protein [Bacteroidales bacterium]
MKRTIRLLLLAAALLTACNNPDPFQYRVFTMGFPNPDGSLFGDDGNTYFFEEKTDWNGAERVVAIFDVLKSVADSTYQARLQSYLVPLYKKPVVYKGELPDSLGAFPIRISDAWYGGRCINMYNVISVREDGAGLHRINLAFDEEASVADTLYFTLTHNFAEGAEETLALVDYGFYTSFNLDGLLPERDSIAIKIDWSWDGNSSSSAGKVKI